MSRPVKTNAHRLYQKTGAGERNITRWMTEAGIDFSNEKKCLAVIAEHRHKTPRKAKDDPKNIDPDSGLTWHQSGEKEKAIAQRIKNQESLMAQSKDWTRTDEMLSIIKNLCTKLDQFPAKLKSQAGLTAEQAATAQKILDDIRAEYAKGL